MKDKATIKEIIKANLKYAISVLCSIFAMAIALVWNWQLSIFIDILGFVLIIPFLAVALILSIR